MSGLWPPARHMRHHIFEHMRAVADDPQIDLDVLVDRRRIDVDVDFFRARREGVEPAGDPVVEARTDGDHQIAIVHRPVGFPSAVHAEHAEPLRIGGRKGAEPHQGRGDRKAGELGKLAQGLARRAAGIDHAAAGIKQRALGGRHHLDRLLDLVGIALELRPIAFVLEFLGLGISPGGELNILGDIDHHRPGPAARGDVESLVQDARQVGDVFDQIIVFGARPGDADRVAFLERVVADEMGRHLAGDDHQRDGVAERIGEAGDRVGGAGPGGHQHGPDLAGRARIAFGRVHRSLLVPHQDVAHFLLLEERVVDRQHGAARIAEDVFNSLVGQRRQHHFRPGHFSHSLLRSLSRPTHLWDFG